MLSGKNNSFSNLWVSQTIATFGYQISIMAIPLIAVRLLKASPVEMGLLQASGFLPILLFSLLAGIWADRYPKIPILVVSDIGRLILLLSIPIAFSSGVLTIEQLYLVAFLIGVCSTFSDVSYITLLAKLVAKKELVSANSKLESTRSLSMTIGPGLAGVLIQLLSAPYAILVNAFGFLLSTLFIRRIIEEKGVEELQEGKKVRESMLQEVKEAYLVIKNHTKLTIIAISSALINLFSTMMAPIFLLFISEEIQFNSLQIGMIFSITGIGGILGSLIANKIANRVGIDNTLVISLLLGAIATLVVPLTWDNSLVPFFYILVTQFVMGTAVTIYRITQISMRIILVSENVLGRVNAFLRLLMMCLVPIGSVLGGVLGNMLGLKITLVISGIGMFFTFCFTMYCFRKTDVSRRQTQHVKYGL